MISKREYGSQIETRALAWFLGRHARARLIARNYTCRMGEIDLIFEEVRERGQLELVFVEVRARTGGSWEDGLSSVGFRKQWRLRRAIARFLAQYRGSARSVRADILAWDGKEWEYFPDISLCG